MTTKTILASSMLVAACGGDGGTGPTTSHAVTGDWSYETHGLQDGHGTVCSTTGTTLVLDQHGVNFTGGARFGSISCNGPGGSFGALLGDGIVSTGKITGDSVSFNIDGTAWRSFGVFVTPDSMAGVVNAIYSPSGTQIILIGRWSATRD